MQLKAERRVVTFAPTFKDIVKQRFKSVSVLIQILCLIFTFKKSK